MGESISESISFIEKKLRELDRKVDVLAKEVWRAIKHRAPDSTLLKLVLRVAKLMREREDIGEFTEFLETMYRAENRLTPDISLRIAEVKTKLSTIARILDNLLLKLYRNLREKPIWLTAMVEKIEKKMSQWQVKPETIEKQPLYETA